MTFWFGSCISKLFHIPSTHEFQSSKNHLARFITATAQPLGTNFLLITYPSDQATWWRALKGRRSLHAQFQRASFHHGAEGRAAGDTQSAGNARLWLLLTLRTVGKQKGQTRGRDITIVVSSTLVTHLHQTGLVSQRISPLCHPLGTNVQMLKPMEDISKPLSSQILSSITVFPTELLPWLPGSFLVWYNPFSQNFKKNSCPEQCHKWSIFSMLSFSAFYRFDSYIWILSLSLFFFEEECHYIAHGPGLPWSYDPSFLSISRLHLCLSSH